MRILFVASEALPYTKTGGLGDVMEALPKALVKLGHEIAVFLPRYRGVKANRFIMPSMTIPQGGRISVFDSSNHVGNCRLVAPSGYFPIEYVPVHSMSKEPSGLDFMEQVPEPLMPLYFPVPLRIFDFEEAGFVLSAEPDPSNV